jgi:hypothetical protein
MCKAGRGQDYSDEGKLPKLYPDVDPKVVAPNVML